jgi:hypothetical protein
MIVVSMHVHTICKNALFLTATLAALTTSDTVVAKTDNAKIETPTIKSGAYRVDLNGKVRDLCVDEIGLSELNAKGWKARLEEQGVRCALSNMRQSPANTQWTGTCSAPGMGKIFNTRHDVSVKINHDDSFEILTLMTGDLSARIPVRGERLRGGAGSCNSQYDTFRPWQ